MSAINVLNLIRNEKISICYYVEINQTSKIILRRQVSMKTLKTKVLLDEHIAISYICH